MVRVAGVEPALLSELDFESDASTPIYPAEAVELPNGRWGHNGCTPKKHLNRGQ